MCRVCRVCKGKSVQGVQVCTVFFPNLCAGVHGLFKNFFAGVQVCTVFSKTFFVRGSAHQRLFRTGLHPAQKKLIEPVCTLHKKNLSNRSAPCTGAQKLFQITLHRCTETFSNHPAQVHRAHYADRQTEEAWTGGYRRLERLAVTGTVPSAYPRFSSGRSPVRADACRVRSGPICHSCDRGVHGRSGRNPSRHCRR